MKKNAITIAFVLLSVLSATVSANPPRMDNQSYIVLLKDSSVVEKIIELTPGASRQLRRRMLFSPAALDYQRTVEMAQARTIEALVSAQSTPASGGGERSSVAPRITVLDQRSFLLNMMIVRCSAESARELRKRPDVKAVYPSRWREPHMDTVPSIVSVTAVWDLLGGVQSAGQGVRIGIIDSGIDPKHAMMTDSTLTPPSGFPRPSEFSSFTNNKVIVAREYVKPAYGYAEQPIKTPQDEMGHGTTVASIAGGAFVNTPYFPLQGMAPKAFLGNYKVFGDPVLNPFCTDQAVVLALNDAVEDQMDIVNMSLGGAAVPASDDAQQDAIAKATAAGVLVVVSAGNETPNPGTVNSPGTSPAAMTVGATTHARRLDYGMEIKSADPLPSQLPLVPYTPAQNLVLTADVGPAPVASIIKNDPTALACTPLPSGSLTGKIALVRRGTCNFSEKAKNAVNAGAIAVVVYQNEPGAPVIMSEIDPALFKAVMIEEEAGELLEGFLAGHAAEVTIHPQSQLFKFQSAVDQLTSFSARGPEVFTLQIKPDLVAPGQNVLAGKMGTAGTSAYAPSIGTSFSAPIVTGAAALIQQLHSSEWSPAALKSSLVNTAERVATWNGQPAGVIHAGNGRLSVAKAAGVQHVLDPVSITFGLVQGAPAQDLERTIEVTNLGASTQTLGVEFVETVSHPNVQLSVTPLALNLAKNEKGKIIVKAHILTPLSYGTFEGYVKLTGPSPSPVITAGYWGSISVPDPGLLLDVASNGASFRTLSSALLAARPGATIEIRDDGFYTGEIALNVNGDGVPLNGLVLRARKGNTPFVLGPDSGAALSLRGLRDVTIDGLVFAGGDYGIEALSSQFSLLNSSIEQPYIGLLSVGSRLNIANSTFNQSGALGILMEDSPALIQNCAVTQTKGNGLFATFWYSDTAAEASFSLFDSNFDKNAGTRNYPGSVVAFVPGVVKGNIIKETTGTTGDGIYAMGRSTSLWVQDNQLLNNSRHGLHGTNGAEVRFLRNQVRNNRSLGLYLVSGKGTVSSSWFTANGRGIRSESSQVEVWNSVITGSTGVPDGEAISADQGKLSLFSSTITRNRKGIRLTGADHLIVNSIINQNSQGDLEGAEQVKVNTNIIGDGTFAGTNGNNQTDPRFADAVGGDFTLKLGSPAIDAASPDYSSGSVDALSLQRVIDGDNDGQAKADIWALEYLSKNGVPVILPVLSSQTDEFVGIAMVNTSFETAHVELTGYSLGGSVQGTPYKKDVAAGAQFSILLSEALPGLKQGWVQITTNKPDLMTFSLLGSNGLTQMDGADLSGAISSKLLFPEIRKQASIDTQLFIVNPNPEQVEVTLTFRTATQNTVLLSQKIAARGAYTRAFSSFGGSNLSGGYVTLDVKEQKPVFAMEIFGNVTTTGGSIAGLLALDAARPQPALFGAQVASTASVDTLLNVINLGTAAADVTIEAFDESGTLVKSVTVAKLAAGQQYRKSASEIFGLGKDLIGWARISAKDGKLVGCLSFSDTGGNFMASLPLQSQPAREFVLGHVAQTADVFTGVTLLNAGIGYAQVSVEVLDRSGVSKGISLFELKPNEKRARLLSEYIPGLAQQEGGFVRVRSSSPIFGFELFGHYLLKFMSAVPQQVVVY